MIALLLLSLSMPAATQSAWFDFVAPREHQSGSYSITGDAVLTAGAASLEEIDSWYAEGWSHRFDLVLSNQSGATLPHHPVRIDLATLPSELFDIARVNGRDLRLFLSDGTEITQVWVEYYNFIAREGYLWFRIPSLGMGTTTLHLYFGHPDHDNGGGWADIFTWATPVEGSYWFYPDGATAHVAPIGGDITFSTEDATPLSIAYDQVTTVTTPRGVIAATGPYSLQASEDCSDIPVPYSLAGTIFVYPAQRSTDQIDLFSPTGNATVTLSDASGPITTVTVSDATPVTLNHDIASATYVITSDLPVIAYHRTVEANDGHPLFPASEELWGVNTGTTYVSALNDNTTVTANWSDGTVTTHTVNANTYVALPNAGILGSGLAVHLVADGPIGAISNGDSTGGEAIAFHPREHLSTLFRIPMNANYLVIAAKDAATRCNIQTVDGTTLTTGLSTAYAPPYANRIYFNTSLTAGNILSCDAPVAPFIEEATLGDERHLLSITAHRPIAWPAPSIATIGSLSRTHYKEGPASVVTPLLEIPDRITAWEEVLFYDPTVFPEGTRITYQLSQDDGATWLWFDGTSWSEVSSLYDANSPVWLQYAFPLLAPLPTLRFKVILESEGAATPVQGPIEVTYTYEEGAAQFSLSAIPSPQTQGQAFDVTVEAQDENGRVLEGYTSPLVVSVIAGTTAPRYAPHITPALVNGRATFKVSILDPAEQITLYVTDGSTNATSNPFDVTALETTDLLYVAGDGQWGLADELLPEPLMVRVLNADGNGVAFQFVSFAVTWGEGLFENGQELMNVETDHNGFAQVYLAPGLGMNRVSASVEGLTSQVSFTLRGDLESDPLLDAEGTNTCTQSPGTHSQGDHQTLLLLALLSLGALLFATRRFAGKPPL